MSANSTRTLYACQGGCNSKLQNPKTWMQHMHRKHNQVHVTENDAPTPITKARKNTTATESTTNSGSQASASVSVEEKAQGNFFCTAGCNRNYITADGFRTHMRTKHGIRDAPLPRREQKAIRKARIDEQKQRDEDLIARLRQELHSAKGSEMRGQAHNSDLQKQLAEAQERVRALGEIEKKMAEDSGDCVAAVTNEECIVCAEETPSASTTAFIPCGHVNVCWDCANHIYNTTRKCPGCRAHIAKIQRLFFL